MKRGGHCRLAIPSRPHAAGAVRGASRQPWTSRAAECAARIPVLQTLWPRVLQRGRRLNLGKTHLPCTRPACTESAFGDRMPQMPAGRPD